MDSLPADQTINFIHMRKILVSLTFLISIASSAQENAIAIGPFTRIDIFGPFQVELIKADNNAMAMEDVDSDHIIQEVRNGELRLKFRNKHYIDTWTSDGYPRQYIHAKIYYTELSEVRAQAGAEVFSEGIIKTRSLTLDCSMGAKMDMEVLTKEVYANVKMGAIVDLEGATKSLEVKASMGGIINANRLASSTTLVNARMGAEVNVNAGKEIEVNAGFGAVVNYSGDPTVRHTHKNFGAEVSGN